MTFDPNQFIVRRPRHSAANGVPGRVTLEAVSDLAGEPQEVQLVDFSRRGAKLELPSAVPPDAQVVIHVKDQSLGLAVEIRGQVMWQRAEGVGRWLLGCRFDEAVPYEVIGELFLSGVLSTATPSE